MNICILAAGQSKRLKSKKSKMLHDVCGRPMIQHVLDAAASLQPTSVGLVVGHQREQIQEALSGQPVKFVVQAEQKGTAHAVSEFLGANADLQGSLLVLSGDTPLLTASLLKAFCDEHVAGKAAISLVTTEVENPTG